MSDQKPRLVEAKFTFQAAPEESTGEYVQFAVRACKSEGQLLVTFDLHGPGGPIEGLHPELLIAIDTTIEEVRKRFKAEEFHEQQE